MKDVIVTGTFCTVDSSDYCEYGVKRNDLIYVYGDFMSHVSEDDPYLFRKLFIAALVEDGHVVEHNKPFTISGDNLKPVSKAKQEKLEATLEEDYGNKEE